MKTIPFGYPIILRHIVPIGVINTMSVLKHDNFELHNCTFASVQIEMTALQQTGKNKQK